MTLSTVPLPDPSLLHVDALPAGTRLAEFELQGLLGVGGFGMVYRAYDHSLQRLVAIKEYMPSALASRSRGLAVSMRSSVDEQGFLAGLKSFLAEARLLAQFDHPSLVKVFRVWEQNNTAYMVMPFYQGVTLKQARQEMRSPPPEAWLRKLLWSVLEALKVLHAHQMVHRDVSPDNIFLQDKGPPVLLDLGAARRAIGDRTQRHTAILKVNYAPIEQYADAEDLRQGAWTDLYSLAAVVHGVLCNDAPLPATFRVVRDRMPSMASVAQTVREQFSIDYTPAFVQAVSQGLAIQPVDRPQNVAAFVDLMRLQPPAGGMDRFDWRAELGDIWRLPEAPAAATEPAPQEEERLMRAERTLAFATQQDPGAVTVMVPAVSTMPQAPTPPDVSDARPAPPARPPPPAKRPLPAARPPFRLWGLAAIGALLVGALAAAGLVSLQNDAPAVAGTAPAVSAASAPASQAEAAAEAASADVVAPLGPVTVEVELRTPAQAASSPAGPSSAPRPAPLAPPAMVPAAAPTPFAEQAPVSPPPVAAPYPSPPPGQQVPSRPASRADMPRSSATVLTAEQICPDSNFFTRPMCLFRECQKPALAALPVCVENNARLQSDGRSQ